ncbi:MAG: hypothetical protein WCO06_03280 [Candidatus Roizmanbacteria bacterium]
MMTEIIFGILAYIFLEVPSTITLLGGTLIVSGIMLSELDGTKKKVKT